MNRDLLLKLVFGGDATGATKAANDSTAAVNRLGAAIKSVPAVSPAAKAFDTLPPKADQATKAVKLTAQQLGQMQFQLQDIAVGLASGQSPFTVMMQQGSQMAQSFASGTGVKGALMAVGQGIKSFLTNPLNLAVVGFGLAATAATSFFSYIMSSGPDTNKLLEDQEKLIKRIGEAYDGAAGKVKAFGIETQNTLLFAANALLGLQKAALAEQMKTFALGGTGMRATANPTPGIGGIGRSSLIAAGSPELLRMVDEFQAAVRRGDGDLKSFVDTINALGNASDDPKLIALITRITEAAGVPRVTEQKFKETQLGVTGLKGDREAINTLLGRGGGGAEAEAKRFERMSQRWAEIMREEAGALDLLTDKQRGNTYELTRAAKEQELLNKAHQVYGETLAPSVVKWIKEEADLYAKKAAAIAYAQNAQQMDMDLTKQQIAVLDGLRGSTSGLVKSFLDAKAAGSSWGDALMGVVDKLTDRFTGLLDKMIETAAFGQQGTSGGLLGGLLSTVTGFFSPQPAPSLYASGAAFTNGIYSRPTMFSHGRGKIGVMAEKGPEAVMPLLFGRGGLSVGASTARGETSLPLTRLSGGKLGVKAFADGDVFGGGMNFAPPANQNGGRGPGLVINQVTHNYTDTKVRTKTTPNASGGVDIETFVTGIVDRHAARGGFDGILQGKFNINKKLNQYG